jgi:hypothetical protein
MQAKFFVGFLDMAGAGLSEFFHETGSNRVRLRHDSIGFEGRNSLAHVRFLLGLGPSDAARQPNGPKTLPSGLNMFPISIGIHIGSSLAFSQGVFLGRAIRLSPSRPIRADMRDYVSFLGRGGILPLSKVFAVISGALPGS